MKKNATPTNQPAPADEQSEPELRLNLDALPHHAKVALGKVILEWYFAWEERQKDAETQTKGSPQ